ncbi:MAG: glycosyltransferase family 4 protein [Crocinitomicaceae bacterium]|nr:glycosyltransferase family 4 protein [Crocinitomicaceae bacterium]
MKIAVNTRLLLRGKLEGIGWFTCETLSRIVKNHPEHEFHFLFDRPFSKEFIFSDNVVPHTIPPPVRHPLLFTLWYDYSVPAMLRKIQPVVFISPDCHASLKTTTPQLTVIHDINFEHYPEDVPRVYARYLKKRSPKYAEQSTRLATVSEFSRKDIANHYRVPEEKIDIVYNGAGELFRVLNSEEKKSTLEKYTGGIDYFLFVGAIHPRKNLQRLLPAFDAFKQKTGSGIQLVVVGEPFWINEEVKYAMDEMKFPSDVHFTGRLQPKELSLLTGAALALVYPSYFEGFGIPVVEGFQSGVPVITSNVSALPEIAGDAALLCDPFAVSSIASALEAIASDPILRHSLIEKGLERAKLYSWDRAANDLWNSIQKTIDHA